MFTAATARNMTTTTSNSNSNSNKRVSQEMKMEQERNVASPLSSSLSHSVASAGYHSAMISSREGQENEAAVGIKSNARKELMIKVRQQQKCISFLSFNQDGLILMRKGLYGEALMKFRCAMDILRNELDVECNDNVAQDEEEVKDEGNKKRKISPGSVSIHNDMNSNACVVPVAASASIADTSSNGTTTAASSLSTTASSPFTVQHQQRASTGTATTAMKVVSIPIFKSSTSRECFDKFCTSVSPHNSFCFYTQAFAIDPSILLQSFNNNNNNTQYFEGLLLGSTTSNSNDTVVSNLTLIILFNMGLACHLSGLVSSSTNDVRSKILLQKALGLYSMVASLLEDVAESYDDDEDNDNGSDDDDDDEDVPSLLPHQNSNSSLVSSLRLQLALWSNMGHIHSHFFQENEATNCRDQLRASLQNDKRRRLNQRRVVVGGQQRRRRRQQQKKKKQNATNLVTSATVSTTDSATTTNTTTTNETTETTTMDVDGSEPTSTMVQEETRNYTVGHDDDLSEEERTLFILNAVLMGHCTRERSAPAA